MRKILFVLLTATFFGCKNPRPENDKPVIQINRILEQEEKRVQDSLKMRSLPIIPLRSKNGRDSLYNF